MRRWLPQLAVRRPVTVLMGFLALCVLGALAYARIPLQMLPSGFDPPYIWIWVPYNDSTPSETDAQLVGPVEEQLATLGGVKRLSTQARSGGASFSLEFYQSVDLDEAYNAVADRLERAMAELPEDAQDYGIFRFDPSDEPVMWAGLSLGDEVEDPYRVITQVVQKRLERLPGVARVEFWGADQKAVRLDFDRQALAAHKVNLYQVMGTLAQENVQLSGGRLTDRGQVRYVRSLARFNSVDELAALPVGPGVRLDDVAELSWRVEPSSSINRIDGKDAVAIAVSKESGANTVEVCAAVAAAFAELEQDPKVPGLTFHSFFNQGELIEQSIQNLTTSAWQGALLAFVVLLVFLRDLRVTLLISAAIPLCLLFTVGALYTTGGSLNLLSLLGLMISVGMVVDNSIVVVETIYRRRQEGLDRAEAAVEGTAEVNLAILLSTATTMVVFLPLILMSEDAMFSFFMGALGFPVVFALAASLVVALVFTPLATAWLRGGVLREEARWERWLAARYSQGLRWVLTRRFDAALGLVALFWLTFAVPFKSVGCTDQERSGLNDFALRFEVPRAFSHRERVAVVDELEGVLNTHREAWGLRVFRTRLNSGNLQGTTYIYLAEDTPAERIDEVREAVLAALPARPGVRYWSGQGGDDASRSNTVIFELEGEDNEVLLDLSAEVLRRLRAAPGVLGAESGLEEEGTEELRVTVRQDVASQQGLSATAIGQTLAFAMRGRQLPPLVLGQDEVALYARFRAEDRQDLDALRDFPLRGASGADIPLRAVTDVAPARGFGSINRTDRRTALPLQVEFEEGVELMEAMAVIGGALETMEFPRGYGWTQGARFDDQVANDQARNMAMLLSVCFVFLLMGTLFESLLLPLAIITTIPMALVGVYWTLWLTDTPLDVMGGVGLVILVGVVVNNGIVLIDTVTELRHQGLGREEALVQAGERRLRPILMTALTTILGLVPMALGTATFIGLPYAPLGRVVGGGIAASTLLTLFCVPYLYTLLDDLSGLGWRVLRFALPRRGPAAVEGK